MIQFFIPMMVVPKQSCRFRKDGPSFTAPRTKRNAEALALMVSKHRLSEPLEGPLSMRLVFLFPWRKGDKKRPTLWKDTKPDWDNLSKQVCDVLQATGFFHNDSQLASVSVEKQWADNGGVQITLWSLTNEP